MLRLISPNLSLDNNLCIVMTLSVLVKRLSSVLGSHAEGRGAALQQWK